MPEIPGVERVSHLVMALLDLHQSRLLPDEVIQSCIVIFLVKSKDACQADAFAADVLVPGAESMGAPGQAWQPGQVNQGWEEINHLEQGVGCLVYFKRARDRDQERYLFDEVDGIFMEFFP